MQCPPTSPGLKFKKFHLVRDSFKTSLTFNFKSLQIMENSFIKAIFTSLCVFSIIFEASALLMLEAFIIFAFTQIDKV